MLNVVAIRQEIQTLELLEKGKSIRRGHLVRMGEVPDTSDHVFNPVFLFPIAHGRIIPFSPRTLPPITEMPFKLSFVELRTDIIPSGCGLIVIVLETKELSELELLILI